MELSHFLSRYTLLPIFLALVLENAPGALWDNCDDDENDPTTNQQQPWSCERSKEYERAMRASPSSCGIYLAPSGMEGAGFGLYATCEPKNGTVVSSKIVCVSTLARFAQFPN
jgi:hypothetical protein